jgi:hypothetical protein
MLLLLVGYTVQDQLELVTETPALKTKFLLQLVDLQE